MSGDPLRVGTPERVELDFRVAELGSRYAAALIDFAIQLALLLAVAVTGDLLIAMAGLSAAVSGQHIAFKDLLLVVILPFFIFFSFLVIFGYFVLFEWLWHGQTPGKRLLHLRVVGPGGRPIGLARSFLRNVLRLVDWLPAFYTLGLLTVLANRRRRRLGDLVAGTLVLREEPWTLRTRTLADSPTLSTRERELAEDFLARRTALETRRRQELAARLADVLARRGIPRMEGEAPEPFLDRLAGGSPRAK